MPASQESIKQGRGGLLPAHWEMVSSFVLSLREDWPSKRSRRCALEPIAGALQSFQMDDDFLCEISQAVEQAGLEMRAVCPEGKLAAVNVRVYTTGQASLRTRAEDVPWLFFVVKQIASSESDNLNAFEDPACFIDLHVYREV